MNRKKGIEKFGRHRWDAMQWVNRYTELGRKRHGDNSSDKVASIRTAGQYINLMTQVSRALPRKVVLENMTPRQFTQILNCYSLEKSQREITNMRLAGQNGFRAKDKYQGLKIPPVRSELKNITEHRAISPSVIKIIHENLSARHKLAFEICAITGIRAHQLHTLAPADEQPMHKRDYADLYPDRAGWVAYTDIGKGGKSGLLMLPKATAERLEATRFDKPITVKDRGVKYRKKLYDIPGGNAMSQAFSRASMRIFGWSKGLHGLRHSYAQRRMHELTRNVGLSFKKALRVVSQELGHLRPGITLVYLR